MNEKPCVLFIEDDRGIFRLVEKKLKKAGYLVKQAETGAAATELFSRNSYEVILIDQTLPDMTGIDLIREFSKEAHCPPLVMVTVSSDTETILEAMRSGASDYILKDTDLRFIDLLPMVILKTTAHHRAIREKIKLESEKRKSDEKYVSLTNQIEEGIWNIDSSFYTISVNRRIAEWIGMDESELRSQHILTFIEAGSIPEFISMLKNLSGKDIRECDLILKSVQNEVIEVHIRGKAICDDFGNIVGFVLTISDRREIISRNKQIIREQYKYQSLIEQTSDFIWETDSGGRIAFANERCLDLLGYTPDEMNGKKFMEFTDAGEADAIGIFFQHQPETREPVFGKQITMVHKSGKQVLLETNLTVLYDESGKWTGYRGISRDITERIEFEKRIKRDKEIESAFAELSRRLIHSTPSEAEIAKMVLHYGLKLTHSQHGFVSVIDRETGNLISHTLTDMMGKECNLTGENQRIVFPIKPDGTYPALWGYALNTKKGFYTNDPASHGASAGVPCGHIPINSFLCAPAIFGGETLGLIAFSNADQYHPEDLAVAERLADIYATTLFRAERERMLIHYQNQMKNIIHSMLDAFALHEIILDDAGKPVNYRFLDVNPAFEKMTGLKADAVIGKTVLDVLPGIEPYWIETYGRVAVTGEPVRFENYSKEIGKYFFVSAFSPEPRKFACIFHDVTFQKTTEEAIRKSEEKYRNLFEISAVGIAIRTIDGGFIEINDAYQRMLGYSKEELEILSTEDITHPEDRSLSEYRMRRIAEGQSDMERYEKRYIHKNGSIVWGDICLRPLRDASGGITGIIAAVIDITERKRAEKSLRESEERYRKLAEDMPVYICTFLPDGTLEYVNQYLAAMTGMQRQELQGKNFYDFLQEPDREKTFEHLQSLTPDSPIEKHEQRYVNSAGEECFQRWTNRAFFDDDKRLIYIQAIGEDITDLIRAEKALRESLQISADVIREIPSGFFIYQYEPPDRLILLDGNPEAQRVTGLRINEWKGREFNELWPEAKNAGITEKYLKVIETGIPYESEELYYEDERLAGVFRIRSFALPGKKLAVAFENITERKKAEKALRDSQAELLLITDNLPFLIAHVSRDLRYLYTNEKYASWYGTTKEEIINRSVAEVIGEVSFKAAEPYYRHVLQGKTVTFERTFKTENNPEVIFKCTFIPNRDEEGNIVSFFAIFEDITEKKTQEIEHTKRFQRIACQNKVLADLSLLTVDPVPDRLTMIKKVTRLSGTCMQVARTSLWFGTERQGYIECIDSFELKSKKHTKGERIYIKDYPDYFNYITRNRYIDAHDAQHDPRTAEFRQSYLEPLKITATLDVPLRMSGEFFGVLCFEHTETKRTWFEDEIRFATETADQLIAILLNVERLEAAENLRISEQRFRTLFENSLDAIVMCDKEGNYINVNDAACRIFHIRREDFLRMNVGDLVKADGTSPKEDYKKFIKVGKESGEFAFRRPDGEVRFTEYSAFRLKENLYVSMLRDITDRKKYEQALRESEEKFEKLFRGSPDMIGISEFGSGRFIDVNEAFCQETGYTRDEILYHTAEELNLLIDPLSPDPFKGCLHLVECYRDDEMNLKMKSGAIKTFLVNCETISFQANKIVFTFLKNITERKKAELQLTHYAAELEMFNEELRQYTNIITHDLRAPLVNMIGFAKELHDQISLLTERIQELITPLASDQSEAVHSILQDMMESFSFIEKSSIRMNSMVDALLTFARLGRREMEWKRVDLNEVVKNIINTLSYNIREKKILLDIQPLPVIIADPFAVDQIIGNVLTNAVQYTHPDRQGRIVIRAEIQEREIIVSIADNGIGIRPEDEHKVFAPFRRGQHKNIPGEGMGLAYVRTLVRKLGGTIRFKSVPDEGTVFYIHFLRKDM